MTATTELYDRVRRLRLRDDDVLILRVLDGADGEAAVLGAASISSLLGRPVVILDCGQTLEAISEEQMARRGWVKKRDG